MDWPSGTVTFLFTDIEGSTRLWQGATAAMEAAVARHDELLRCAIEARGGVVFSTSGDGMAAAFQAASAAVAAALEAQDRLGEEPWPAETPIRVRMALHTGEAQLREGDYFGTALNRCARLMALSSGGQVLCSRATAELVESAEVRHLGEHRLRDVVGLHAVFQVGGGDFPPIRSAGLVLNNLPLSWTSLVGRDEEVRTVGPLIDEWRLVTLTGVGGVGKTRLALALAAERLEGFPDGCWLVELAPLRAGAELVKTVASAIGTSTTDRHGLTRYLAERHLLLVLDNCEHLLDDVAQFVGEVLSCAPWVRILTTSREPLGLDGEVVRRVPSLSVAPPDSDPEAALRAPATRLFVDRATAASDAFALTSGNVDAVNEICSHLDGIPLAIELAAARVRALPVEAIAARLGERFKMLGGGSHRAQGRHQTLQATVAWSYDLLAEEERLVFRRLGVFPATFELESAEAVVGEPGIDVVACLVHLVDRSLVVLEPDSGRYRLLETLRQYAIERLVGAGEATAAFERHARTFLALTEVLSPHFGDARYGPARARLEAELDNLRTVADWCAEQGRWDELLALCRRTFVFARSCAAQDGARWYRLVLDHDRALGGQGLVDSLGELAYLLGSRLNDAAAASWASARSHQLATAGPLHPSPWALETDAVLATHRGDFESAIDAGRRVLEEATRRQDVQVAVIGRGTLAICLAGIGDHPAARRTALEAVQAAQESRCPSLLAQTVFTAAMTLTVWAEVPDHQAALELLVRHTGDLDVSGIDALWLELAWALSLMEAGRPSIGHFREVARLADQLGVPGTLAAALRCIALHLADEGRRWEAAALEGYYDATLSAYFVSTLGSERIMARLEAALADYPDRSRAAAAGARSSRNEIRALVVGTLQALEGSEELGP